MIPSRTRPLGGGDLPAGYTRLEYLEATGEQYIITDLLATGSMKFELEFLATDMGGLAPVYGVHEENAHSSLYYNYSNAYGHVGRFVYGNTYYYPYFDSGSFQLNKKYHMLVDGPHVWRNGEKLQRYRLVSGEFQGVPAEESFVSTLPVALFATNGALARRTGIKRIYNFRASDKGELKLNLIPALDPTGAPCMFDTVTRKPFYNAGSGEFLYA